MPHEMKVGRARRGIGYGFLAGFIVIGVCAMLSAREQSRPPSSANLRMYMFDLGGLPVADPKNFGLKREEVAADRISVVGFLVVHPKGTLLWDTGVVPDALIGSGKPGADRAGKSLKGQLVEIGYQPANITYLALSHLHSDHSANSNDYAGSTWLVRKAERDAMFGEKPYPNANNPAFYSALKDAKTTLIDGDYDVFGDGTVVIKPTPGHTPGHQVLFVNLPKTGPVVLSGDLYHYPEQIPLKRFYSNNFDLDQYRASREALDVFMKKTGAQLWIQHDFIGNSKRKKSPEYYE